MIQWWLFPFLCTLAAVFLMGLTHYDCNLPYRGFMTVAILVVVAPILTLMWLFCFLLSLMCP
ncbi:hypothetical protein [Massilia sp. TN1-12]|uniref:hypothetical protein n=1 Tax=Massilia paldalensis TaxID=3377675 RepID=UPI00384B8BB0